MKLDMVKYTREFTRLTIQLTGTAIRNKAREIVRVGHDPTTGQATGDLRNSIRFDLLSRERGEVSANQPYAAAQEWGRPDLARYGFTPYMRPATTEVINNQFTRIVGEADATAQRLARV